jgi:hypothetical protein
MTKKHLIDGQGNSAGDSAIPESHYWYSLYQEVTVKRSIVPAAKPTWLEAVAAQRRLAISSNALNASPLGIVAKCAKLTVSIGKWDTNVTARHWTNG